MSRTPNQWTNFSKHWFRITLRHLYLPSYTFYPTLRSPITDYEKGRKLYAPSPTSARTFWLILLTLQNALVLILEILIPIHIHTIFHMSSQVRLLRKLS